MLSEYKEIRNSKPLNKLLFNNMATLEQIFWRAKWSKSTFTFFSANTLFSSLNHADFNYNEEVVEKAFIYCMMTVLDEYKKMHKYQYLELIEFIDMLCRIAINSIETEGTTIE